MNRPRSLRKFGLALGLAVVSAFVIATPASAQNNTTWLTNAANGTWGTSGNWSNGVPGGSPYSNVFFTTWASGTTITAVGPIFWNNMTFSGDQSFQLNLTPASSIFAMYGTAFTVSGGAGAITLGPSGTNSVVQLFSTSPITFTNNSSGLLTLPSVGSYGTAAAGTRNVTFGGSGNISVESLFFRNSSSFALDMNVIKSGAGTLTITGSSTAYGGLPKTAAQGSLMLYGGSTTINAGTLQIGVGGTTGMIGLGAISGSAGGTLAFNRSDNYGGAFPNTIGGGIGLSVASGTLTLSGTNTYSGATTVSGGLLVAGGTSAFGSAAPLVVNAGTVSLGGFSVSVGGLSGSSGGRITTGTAAGTATLTTSVASGVSTFSGAIVDNGSGLVALTKSGAGTLALDGSNTYTGATSVNAGTLQVTSGSLASPTVTVAGGATLSGGGTLNATTVANLGILSPGVGGVGTLSLSSLTFSGSGTINVGLQSNTTSSLLAVNGNVTTSGGANSVAFALGSGLSSVTTGTYTLLSYTGSQLSDVSAFTYTGSVGGRQAVALANGTKAVNLVITNAFPIWSGSNGTGWSTANNWVLNSNGSPTSFQANDTVLFNDTATTGTVTLSADVAPATTTFSGTTLAYTLSSPGGFGITSGAVVKSGPSTLTISTSNSFSGGTTLSAGTLRVGNNAALGTGTVAFNGGTLSSDSVTGRSLANAVAIGGDVTLGDAVNSGTLTVSGAVDLGSATRQITTPSNVTLSGVVSSGGLTKAGGGVLTLTGSNTYAGATSVNAGTLQIGNSGTTGSLSASSAISGSAGGALAFSRTDNYGGNVANTISGGIGVAVNSGTLALSGNNSYTGGTQINAGVLNLGSANAIGSTGTISFSGGTLQFSSANTTDFSSRFSTAANQAYSLDTNGQNVTLASALTSSGGTLTKSGAGTLTLSASNSYTGGTQINAGVLAFGNTRALGTGTVSLAAATLQAALSGTFANPISVPASGVIDSNNNTVTFSGVISGAGGLSKAGSSGTAILAGNNSFTGNVVVGVFGDAAVASPSVLVVTRDTSLGTGNKTVTLTTYGRTLALDGSGGNITLGSNIGYTLSNTGLALSGNPAAPALRNLAGNNTIAGAINLTSGGGGLSVQSDAGQLTLAGNISADFAGRLVYLDGAANGVISGTIADGIAGGIGLLQKQGSGTWTLSAANTYTGSTSVIAGTLQIGSAGRINSTGGITINGAAAEFKYNSATALTQPITFTAGTLSGTGTIGTAVTVGTSDILSPGNSPGSQSFTQGLTFAPAGKYVWEINNWTSGSAGTNYDQLVVSGSALNITATSGTTFTIALTGLTAGNVAGAVPGFSGNAGTSFTIATSSAGITGFDKSKFSIDQSAFTNNNTLPPNAGFWLSTSSTSLILNYAPSATYNLSANATATAIRVGGTSTITATVTSSTASVTNPDSLSYTGLALSGSLGTLSSTSGTLAGGANGSGNAAFTTLATGSYTFTPSLTSATNVNVGTSANAGTTSGVTVSVYNPAAANSFSGTTVALANVHVGGSFGTQSISIWNTGTASAAFQEGLAASVSGTAGGASGSGSFANLFTGSTSTAISVGLGNASTTTAGTRSGTVTLGFTSTGATSSGATGLLPLTLASQTVAVTGTVFNYAVANNITTPISLGNVYVGGTFGTSALTISNTAPSTFSEGLNAAFGAKSTVISNNGLSITNLVGGGTDATLTVGLGGSANTGVAGALSGTQTITLVSNGANSGLGNTSLASQTLSITGTVWNPAAVNTLSAVSLGNVRVGGTFANSAISIQNTAVSGSYTEVLGASGTGSGLASLTGTVSGLAGNQTSTAILVGLGGSANTGAAGIKSGSATLNFTSTGGPGTFVPTAQTIAVTGTVWNMAAGSITSGTTVNLGLIHAGGSFDTQSLAIQNTAANNGYSEGLNAAVSGSSGDASFGGTGIANLSAGSSSSTITVGLANANTAIGGSKTGSITIGYQSNGSTTSGLSTVSAGSQTVSLTGSVFSGNATWSVNGGGSWGMQGSGTSWSSAGGVQAAPGTFTGYDHTDSATFGNALTGGTATISLGSSAPSLAAITFSNSAASYQLSGGSLGLNGGTSSALMTVSAGTHGIGSAIGLASNASIDIAADSILTLSGIISGSSYGLMKTGLGTLNLNAINTYGGNTSINAGTVRIGDSHAFGTVGTVTLASGATLDLNNLTISNAITNLGGTIINSGSYTGTQTVSGSSSFTGDTGGTIDVTTGGNASFAGTVSGSVGIGAGAMGSFSGGVTGSVSVAGTALVTSTIGSGAALGVAGGGLLTFGNGAVVNSTASLSNDGQFIVDRSSATALQIAAGISGTGSFAVNSGVVQLTGTSDYSGLTSVSGSGSVLKVNGSLKNTSGVDIGSGALLGGSGVIAGVLTGSGLVSPGNSPGILTAGQFDPTGGLAAAFEFTKATPDYTSPTGSLNDVLRLTGGDPFAGQSLTSSNVIDVYFNVSSISSGNVFEGGFFTGQTAAELLAAVQHATFHYWVQDAGGSTFFNGSHYSNLTSMPGLTGVTVQTANVTRNFGAGISDVTGSVTQFVVVPEPASWALAGIGIGLAGWAVRRRRCRAS